MHNEQDSIISSPKSDIKRLDKMSLLNLSSSDDEGGLKLGQMFQSLRRQWPVIIGVTIVVTSLALLRAVTSKPTYQAEFEILARSITEESRVISVVTKDNSNDGNEKSPIAPATLKILKSPSILTPIVEQLKLKHPNINYESLESGLKLKTLPDSAILNVSYEDKNSTKVKDILYLVSKAYINYSLQERLSDVQQGIEFVDSQLPQVQERSKKLQDQLQGFRQKYNLIDPESLSKQLASQISTISQERLENQVKLDETRALFIELNRQITEPTVNAKASSAFQNNARYQSLLAQVQALESQIAKELSVFTENSDRVQALRDQLGNLMPLLSQEEQRTRELIGSKIQELEDRNEVLSQAEEQLNQQVKLLSVVSRQYTDIQQEIKITNDTLNQFLTKREALIIDAGQRKTPWQILTPLKDPVPSSADAKRNVVLGAILGLLVGIGVALLLDKLSNLLRTSEEVRVLAKLPILGVIPFNSALIVEARQDDMFDMISVNQSLSEKDNQTFIGKLTKIAKFIPLVPRSGESLEDKTNPKNPFYTTSLFLESFRSLYTNVRLLSPDNEIRSVVISSSIPGEGKTTTSVYLAQAAAALGKRVLLVDADLRRPKIHIQLLLSNVLGLSNLISADLSFDEVVQRSPLEPNLSILTSGQVPPDPTRLLSSQKMQSLMQLFHDKFDLVIYDTPPLIGMVDAKLIASTTDGLIMVVGLDKAKSSNLNQALESLSNSPITVFGIIANGSKDYAAGMSDTYQKLYGDA